MSLIPTLLHKCVAYISFCCRCFHGPLLTIGAGPVHDLGLVAVVLDGLDLPWMLGKKPELYVVVVFLRTLDPINSHDPLLSRHNHMPPIVLWHHIVGYLHDLGC